MHFSLVWVSSLIDMCGPLIMTSANLSDIPIIKDDEEMFRFESAVTVMMEKSYWQGYSIIQGR